MPRKPKTQTGRRAQGIEAIAGQTYGRGVEQEELQRAMPAPNSAAEAQTQIARQAQAAASPPQAAGAPPQPMDFGALLAAAQGQGHGAGLFMNPTARPNEPQTAGLPIGRGPGPEVLSIPRADPPGVRFLEKVAQATGDQYFADLARRGRP